MNLVIKSRLLFVEHFGELHRVTLLRNQSLYTLPVGETKPYFSFERVARRVSEAHVSDNPALRHTSVANKWKTIHLLLHPGHNATRIQYNITFQREDDTEFQMSFTVAVDPREVPQNNVSKTLSKEEGHESKLTPTREPVFPFSDIPVEKRGPKTHKRGPGKSAGTIQVPAINVSLLPAVVRSELQKLEEKLLIGDITLKGYNFTKAELLKPYKSLSEKQQDVHLEAGRVEGRPYKDLEAVHPEGKAPVRIDTPKIVQKNPNSDEQKNLKEENKLVTPFVPIPIDDVLKNIVSPKPYPLKAAIERPMIAKLLGNFSQKRSEEARAEPPAAPVVGRRLQQFTSSDRGFLPWERRKYFQALLEVSRSFKLLIFTPPFLQIVYVRLSPQENERLQKELSYETDGTATGRKLRDTFADSLRYVNKLLNGQFGFTSRKVPAHMPHMIDRLVMQELQDM